MHVDVTELMAFYRERRGMMVRRLLAYRLWARWRGIAGQTVIGLGYATPYLGAFSGDAGCLAALMPAGQGVVAWPSDGPYRALLTEEDKFPLPDACIDRIIAVHSLEMSTHVEALLREIWRVMRPEGRALFIVPNRRSVWASIDTTPFGHGRPYSRGQFERLLASAMFEIVDWSSALHVPPTRLRMLDRYAASVERMGAAAWPAFGGVFIVEVTKRVHAPLEGKKLKTRDVRFGVAPVARPRGLTAPRGLTNPRG